MSEAEPAGPAATAAPAAPARDLEARLVARVRSDGPMSVAAFMAEALYDPRAGYYATKDPIGAGGDYVTAPEISQMFGELCGLWALQCWLDMGRPAPFRLIELGPGRGTLMRDALRAAAIRADFIAALSVSLVEVSPALQSAQAAALANAPVQAGWARRLEDVPAGPAVILANEFLDCLPVRQFVRLEDGWRERMVGLDPAAPERLAYVFDRLPAPDADIALIPETLRDAAEGAIVEVRPAAGAVLDALAARLIADPGAALFVDYGPAAPETGDTVQALKEHNKLDPLGAPGERDITARVDFASFAQEARARGLAAHGPVAQGGWLASLGLEHRAAALMKARPEKRASIARQVFRLCDPSQMGALFKALSVTAPDMSAPPGFPAPPEPSPASQADGAGRP